MPPAGNLRQQQNAIVNATPLPVADPSTDVTDTIPLTDDGGGAAALVDAPEDDHSWMTGGVFRIKDQAEWDALPEERKEVVRAAVAMGGQLPMSDAMAIYKSTRKTQQEATPQEVMLPDGSKVYKIGSQIVNPAEIRAKEMELSMKMGEALAKDREREKEVGAATMNLERIGKFRDYVNEPGIVGPTAGARQMVDGWANPQNFTKRRELEVMAKTSVLENLQNFKGQISNAEREFLEKMFPKISDPKETWVSYFDSAEQVFTRAADGGNVKRGTATAAAPVASFGSAADVKAAFKAGKLSREEAMRTLAGFGMK